MNKRKDQFAGENVNNAFYSPSKNEVQINTGLLKGFGYNIDMPKGILYGGCVGSTLGHELTHGFDDDGKNFGRLGNLFSWWEDVADAAYRSQSKCMVKQYSDFKIHHNGSAYSANGESTLGENIADNGGAKLGYRTFLKYLEENEHKCLDSVDFSPKQLFWIGWAQDWCIMSEFDYETSWEGYEVTNRVHAPEPWRVNTVFSNMPEFAHDFHCPVGSKLNPERRCNVW